jgi:hypothetical protein
MNGQGLPAPSSVTPSTIRQASSKRRMAIRAHRGIKSAFVFDVALLGFVEGVD